MRERAIRYKKRQGNELQKPWHIQRTARRCEPIRCIRPNEENTIMEIISSDQVNWWLGSDVTRAELIELIEAFANGQYTRKQLNDDISNFMESGEH